MHTMQSHTQMHTPDVAAMAFRSFEGIPEDDSAETLHIQYDVTSISLEEMQQLSDALFAKGVLSETEHELLSFHMQICSDFDMFVALLGSIMEEPHKHRNFLGIWNNILAYQERNFSTAPLTRHLRRVAAVLSTFQGQQGGARYVA